MHNMFKDNFMGTVSHQTHCFELKTNFSFKQFNFFQVNGEEIFNLDGPFHKQQCTQTLDKCTTCSRTITDAQQVMEAIVLKNKSWNCVFPPKSSTFSFEKFNILNAYRWRNFAICRNIFTHNDVCRPWSNVQHV